MAEKQITQNQQVQTFTVNYVWKFSDSGFTKYSFLLLILEKQAYILRGGKKEGAWTKRMEEKIKEKNIHVHLREKLVQNHQRRPCIFWITLMFVIS